MLTRHTESTFPEPIIPNPWDDRQLNDNSDINEFLNQMNRLDPEDDEEDPDPTTIPVNSILIIYSKYIANILTG